MNAVEIGLVENLVQSHVPDTKVMAVRVLYVVIGMCAISAGSGLYIGAQFGSGPRDGLMLGLNQRFGISVRLARTVVEEDELCGRTMQPNDLDSSLTT